MKQKWIPGVCLMIVALLLSGFSEISLADQTVTSNSQSEPTPAGSETSSAGGSFEFVRFFTGTFGPDVSVNSDWFMSPLEVTGSSVFGDSVQNPTAFRTDGTYVSGSDIDRASSTRTINDPTLRDRVNAFRTDPTGANRNNVEASLQDYGFAGPFIIE